MIRGEQELPSLPSVLPLPLRNPLRTRPPLLLLDHDPAESRAAIDDLLIRPRHKDVGNHR